MGPLISTPARGSVGVDTDGILIYTCYVLLSCIDYIISTVFPDRPLQHRRCKKEKRHALYVILLPARKLPEWIVCKVPTSDPVASQQPKHNSQCAMKQTKINTDTPAVYVLTCPPYLPDRPLPIPCTCRTKPDQRTSMSRVVLLWELLAEQVQR